MPILNLVGYAVITATFWLVIFPELLHTDETPYVRAVHS